MLLYWENGQTEKTKNMAHILLEKPVKVPSTDINDIQEAAMMMIVEE